MIITTTHVIEGHKIKAYKGIVFGEVITGVNVLKDIGANFRNFFGGRSEGYEQELMQAREEAIKEMAQRAKDLGADAIVGVDIDYEVLGQGDMLMVTASGTAVILDN